MSDLNLPHYLDLWRLSDPQPLAATATSHVYTVTFEGQTVVLKLLTELGTEERNGAIALRHFGGQGAVRLLQADDQAHLLEYAAGDDLTRMVNQGDDESATEILADVLNTLHAASTPPPQGLTPLRVWFRALFEQAEADQKDGIESMYIRAAALAHRLLAQPQDICVLHGDIHHENVRWKAGRGWLAFDPKGLIGERTFDATNIFRNPYKQHDLVYSETRLLKTVAILARQMQVSEARLLAFVYVYACLSAAWFVNDALRSHSDLRIAALVEPHIAPLL